MASFSAISSVLFHPILEPYYWLLDTLGNYSRWSSSFRLPRDVIPVYSVTLLSSGFERIQNQNCWRVEGLGFDQEQAWCVRIRVTVLLRDKSPLKTKLFEKSDRSFSCWGVSKWRQSHTSSTLFSFCVERVLESIFFRLETLFVTKQAWCVDCSMAPYVPVHVEELSSAH